MPSLEEALMGALEMTLEAEVPPQEPSITDLVNVLGGPRRGGGTTRLAAMLDVKPRTIQRWLKTERGEAGETRTAPTARVRGLTAAQRATLDQIRGLWTDRDRRIDVLERKLHGRKLVVDWDITWEPYPEVIPGGVRRVPAPPWRDEGRWSPVTIPEYRAAPIIRNGIEVLRTGDAEVLDHAAGLLAGELAGWLGLPGKAEADEVHSLTISFE
jgi:hypothetical protein